MSAVYAEKRRVKRGRGHYYDTLKKHQRFHYETLKRSGERVLFADSTKSLLIFYIPSRGDTPIPGLCFVVGDISIRLDQEGLFEREKDKAKLAQAIEDFSDYKDVVEILSKLYTPFYSIRFRIIIDELEHLYLTKYFV
ncbi:MAG: hypothetical protein HRT57_12360 [Crocinitomicaceae bacterium]|nr:hypothetical protein [Crocinitomicaceae bacterium]